MKRFLFALFILTITAKIFAGTTATLNIKGKVPRTLDITVTPLTIATALDLTTSKTNLVVATSVEKSNSQTGHKVFLSSANNSKLKHAQGDTFNYTFRYGNRTINLSASSGTPVLAATVSTIGVSTNSRNISISYTGKAAATMKAGDYLDTLTFTIAAQ